MIQSTMASTLKTTTVKSDSFKSAAQAITLEAFPDNSSPQTLSPHERIIQTANVLFYEHVPSKDDLIRAVLEAGSVWYENWMNSMIATQTSPRAQLEAIFDGVAQLAISPECKGCGFMNVAGEFPDMIHPGHAAALRYKSGVIRKLEALAVAAKAKDPNGLAQDLLLVMDGAWAAARMFGANNHASRAGATARILIAAQF
jgi:AcrR family transcriptional regulator